MCTDDEFATLVAAATSIHEIISGLCQDDAKSATHVRARIGKAGLSSTHFKRRGVLRYSDEELRVAVAGVNSMTAAIKALGASWDGGGHKHMSRRVEALGLDTSHFQRQEVPTLTERRGWEDVLIIRQKDTRRESVTTLRRALLEAGVSHRCKRCGISTWNGEPLVLEIDHINMECWDNRLENLRFLCPNCHSLETAKQFLKKRAPKNTCLDCSTPILKESQRCLRCHGRALERPTKTAWPDAKELFARLTAGESYEALGRELGVSGAAVKKHLRRNGVEPPRKYERTGKYSKKQAGA